MVTWWSDRKNQSFCRGSGEETANHISWGWKWRFCPTLKLGQDDFVMPRKNYPVWDLICRDSSLIKAKIHEWNNGEELEKTLLHLIHTIKIDNNNSRNSSNSSDESIDSSAFISSAADCEFHCSIPLMGSHEQPIDQALPVPH